MAILYPPDPESLSAGDQAAQWLAATSHKWLALWRGPLLHRQGFHPFDALAVGYVIDPARFHCRSKRARIGFSVFLEPLALGRDLEVRQDGPGRIVTHCLDVDRDFKQEMLLRLRGASKRATGGLGSPTDGR